MNRVVRLIIVLFLIPCSFIIAQEQRGIHFEEGLSWDNVLEKAKKENKYIFVDCYATWCGPCKQMDNSVYPEKEVGDFMNSIFISVKVQMDQTPSDAAAIKKWYYNASELMKKYSVNAFPTYLLFFPDGRPMQKLTGFKNSKQFLKDMKESFLPEKQYYQLLSDFKPGVMDTAELKGLARSFESSSKVLGGQLAADYLSRIPEEQLSYTDNGRLMWQFQNNGTVRRIAARYISGIPLKEFSQVNPQFLTAFRTEPEVQQRFLEYVESKGLQILHTKNEIQLIKVFAHVIKIGDKFYNWLFSNEKRIDSIAGQKLYTRVILDYVISRQMLVRYTPPVNQVLKDIDWNAMLADIEKIADVNYAQRIVINQKVDWYKNRTLEATKQKDSLKRFYWGPLFAKAVADQVEYNFPRMDSIGNGGLAYGYGNNIENSIYYYCHDSKIIHKAVDWMGKIQLEMPGLFFSYVYAGLLYRDGQVGQAIKWQEHTLDLINAELFKYKDDMNRVQQYQDHLAILNAMKRKEVGNHLIYGFNYSFD